MGDRRAGRGGTGLPEEFEASKGMCVTPGFSFDWDCSHAPLRKGHLCIVPILTVVTNAMTVADTGASHVSQGVWSCMSSIKKVPRKSHLNTIGLLCCDAAEQAAIHYHVVQVVFVQSMCFDMWLHLHCQVLPQCCKTMHDCAFHESQ